MLSGEWWNRRGQISKSKVQISNVESPRQISKSKVKKSNVESPAAMSIVVRPPAYFSSS
jgi:hypothetical protein